MRHLGSRVSALLDGQLSAVEEDEAWRHVHACHACRDLVEREGWIKTQLVGLAGTPAPSYLKGALGDPVQCANRRCRQPEPCRRPTMALLGGGALGAAALGMLALVAGPGAPVERPPVSSISGVGSSGVTATVDHRSTPLRISTRHVRIGVPGVRLVP